MLLSSSVIFLILVTVSSVYSRRIEYGKLMGPSRPHEEKRRIEDPSMFLSKSHLRIHMRPPAVVHAKEGDSQFLECQAGGNPPPRIYWLKGGEMISRLNLQDELDMKEENERSFSKLEIASTTSRLYLECLSMEDEADYTCVAETGKLRESSTSRLTVSSSDERKCLNKMLFGQAPRIVSWTKTMLENQGENTKLMCRAEGVPKPSIKWLDPREEEIDSEDTGKYEILPNGDLIVRNLKWSDMGNYVCTAENNHGTARAEIFLYPANPEL